MIAAPDGPRALELAAAEPHIDLLLTDVVLPGGMGGREVAEALQRRRPGIPVLYVSGYSEGVIQHRGRLDPGVQLLSKPFDRRGLAAAVREALSRRPAAG